MRRVLEVEPSCRDETIIRKAYLEKVKQYHPDAAFRDSKADQAKFNQVQQAYETLTVTFLSPRSSMHDKSAVLLFKEALKTDELPIQESPDDIRMKFDIRHTAPQHRTHLEYGGYGLVACRFSFLTRIVGW